MCMHRNRKPCNFLSVVITASGMDRGCMSPTMTMTILSNMVAILQLIVRLRHAYIGQPCYGQLTPVKTRYPLIVLQAQV